MVKKNVTINDLAIMINKGFNKTATIEHVDNKVAHLDNKIDGLKKWAEGKFDKIDKRFDKIEKIILDDHR